MMKSYRIGACYLSGLVFSASLLGACASPDGSSMDTEEDGVAEASSAVLASTAVAAPADYDGDGVVDLAAKDSTGLWCINYASNGFAWGWDECFGGYGDSTAVPVPADYDGDGKADLSVKNAAGVWYINYASNGFASGWDASYVGSGDSTA